MENTIKNYPDVLSVDELQHILRIGRSATYTLLKENKIKTLKVGNRYIIPKQSVIDFLNIN
ncbi:MAG: helix-turn-helix domain-containing protein [Eubacterium sp.]|nr:helix-turn-helix domain-containing protein [Eubacterium sp.]